jgi:hypothetical protein
MATVGVVGPFERTDALEPGQALWVDFGEHEGFGNCALSITASAHDGKGGSVHVLKVDDVNVSAVESDAGDIAIVTYSAGCNVINNGTTVITDWSVLVGVTVP